MEENMNYEEVETDEVETDEVETEKNGIGTGMAMLIGAGLTVATTAIIKLGKKAYAKIKSNKESRRSKDDVEDMTDEEDMDEE